MNTWRKSSRSGSGAQDINCVELAALPNARHLTLTADQLAALLADIKADKFSL